MTSAIDATKPTHGVAYTQDVRENFATAASEISALQAAGPYLPLNGAVAMQGPLHLAANSLDTSSADHNDTALIVPAWTPCWPVANSPDPGNGTGNAVRSQMVVQAQTALDSTYPEWTAVFGNYVNTGSPGGQKVSVYSGVVQGPNAGAAWALNTDIVRNGVPGPRSNVPGGPSGIGSATPGTPGSVGTSDSTIGFELDFTNWDQDCPPGGPFTVGMYVHNQSTFASLAGIYYDSQPQAVPSNYAWHDGIYFAGAYTIKDNAIFDASNAAYSHQAIGTRGGATFYANDTAPFGLVIAGNHATADIWANDNATTVLRVSGTHAQIVDASSATISGAAWNGNFSATSINNTPIGGTTPAAGAFSTLSASGAVSGAGFTNLFASPPAIGGTTPAAGTFTTATATGILTVGSGAFGQVNAVGNGNLYLGNSRGGAVEIADTGGAIANQIQLQANITGFGPTISVIGSDTNIHLNLSAKGTGAVWATSNIHTNGTYFVASTQVVGPQIAGYGTPTGGAKLANFPGASATLAQTSGALAQLILDLKAHGLLGA